MFNNKELVPRITKAPEIITSIKNPPLLAGVTFYEKELIELLNYAPKLIAKSSGDSPDLKLKSILLQGGLIIAPPNSESAHQSITIPIDLSSYLSSYEIFSTYFAYKHEKYDGESGYYHPATNLIRLNLDTIFLCHIFAASFLAHEELNNKIYSSNSLAQVVLDNLHEHTARVFGHELLHASQNLGFLKFIQQTIISQFSDKNEDDDKAYKLETHPTLLSKSKKALNIIPNLSKDQVAGLIEISNEAYQHYHDLDYS